MAVILTLIFIATAVFATPALALTDSAPFVLNEGKDGQEDSSGDGKLKTISIGSAPEFVLDVDFTGFDPEKFSINGIKTVPGLNSKGDIQVYTKDLVVAVAGKEALEETEKLDPKDAAIENSKLVPNDEGKISVKNIYYLYWSIKNYLLTDAGINANRILADAPEEVRELFRDFKSSVDGIVSIYTSTRSSETNKWSPETMKRCQEIIKRFLSTYAACKESLDPRLQNILKSIEANKDFSAFRNVIFAADWSIFEEKGALIQEIQKIISNGGLIGSEDLLKDKPIVFAGGTETLTLAVGSVWQSAQSSGNGYLCQGCGSNPCKCVPLIENGGVPPVVPDLSASDELVEG